MADFRKMFYGLAMGSLLVGLSASAYAQGPIVCTTNAAVPPIVRGEGFTELVGDLVIDCTGGQPTRPGDVVPPVNITILLSTNVTSKLLSGIFNEALLVIDEPNSGVGAQLTGLDNHTNRPFLNCGATGAPDISLSGPNVCAIVAPNDPRATYDGTPNGYFRGVDASLFCDGVLAGVGQTAVGNFGTLNGSPVAGSYGCGRPNVFQGRQAQSQIAQQNNSVVWLGVPFDPPGDGKHRILRITNVRADATYVSGLNLSQFATGQIQMDVAINATTSISIPNPRQLVAYVQRGLNVSNSASRTDYLQCQDQSLSFYPLADSVNANSHTRKVNPNAVLLNTTNTPSYNPQGTSITFQEGFASSFKPRGWEQINANGTFSASRWNYKDGNGAAAVSVVDAAGARLRQNVPGALYNTESGLNNPPTGTIWGTPNPNPPQGIGAYTVGTGTNFFTNGTGIETAGVATQGTRFILQLTAVPGSSVSTPAAVWLVRSGSGTSLTSNANSGVVTGIAVRVYSPTSNGSGGTPGTGGVGLPNAPQTWVTAIAAPATSGVVVYEVLFDDPQAVEEVVIPLGISFTQDLSKNLPDPTVKGTVAGGFAPFYARGGGPENAHQPSSTLPVPRFTPGTTPVDFYSINKCACNLLFPFVASTGLNGFDTALAIANTSADPTNTGQDTGFTALAQGGGLKFWYFNTGSGQAAVAAQCPNSTAAGTCPGNIVVPAGGTYVYQLSQGSTAATGVSAGLKDTAKAFVGYMIVRTDFQYCHGFAYISATGAGPTSPGISVGYLGLVMDKFGDLSRTIQLNSDQMVH